MTYWLFYQICFNKQSYFCKIDWQCYYSYIFVLTGNSYQNNLTWHWHSFCI